MANKNVFTTYLDNYSSTVTLTNAIKDKVSLRYPASLATKNDGIPFTLFMPYKRPQSFGGLRSIQDDSEIFELLPEPEFSIALPTPPSALKTQYAAQYADVNLGQGVGIGLKSLGINGTTTNTEGLAKIATLGAGVAAGAVLGNYVGGKKGAGIGVVVLKE